MKYLIFILFFLLARSTMSEQLIKNPSFENITPAYWDKITWEGQPPLYDFFSDGVDSSGRSSSIFADKETNSALFTSAPVIPNTEYKLSGWIKTKDVTPSSGMGAAIILDFDQHLVRKITGTNHWTPVEFNFNSGPRDSIKIYCILGLWGKARGKVWFDQLTLTPANSPAKNKKMEIVSINSRYFNIPILKNKRNNPFARVEINTDGDISPLSVQDIELSLSDNVNSNFIHEFSAFYTYLSPKFSSEIQFGNFTSPIKPIKIKGNFKLKNGMNYFWICCDLKHKDCLNDKIKLKIQSLTINNKEVEIKNGPFHTFRTGFALRKTNDDGVHTYRIPAITTTGKGSLIAVYDVRRNNSKDLQEDIDVGISKSTDLGENWGPMKIIMDMKTWGNKGEKANGIGDPAVLFDSVENTLWAAATWHHGNPGKVSYFASDSGLTPDKTNQLMLCKSRDDGKTWSKLINITKSIKKPEWKIVFQGPGRGITTPKGVIVFPAQYKDEKDISFSTILYSLDHGKTWTLGAGAKSETTEAQVVDLNSGELMLNMRDNRGKFRSIMTTKDLGETWEKHSSDRKALIGPVCNGALLKVNYKKREILFFANPNSQEKRTQMTIKTSFDAGKTWPSKNQVLVDELAGFGYPSLTQVDKEHIGILYESSQAHLVFQKIKITDLIHQL